MQVRRNAIFPEVLKVVRADVLGMMEKLAENHIWNLQRGIGLSLETPKSISVLTEYLELFLNLPCDLGRCSARLQECHGHFQLRWHQDCVPMDLKGGETGVVVWVPLDPIDGTRPSLEIASECDLKQHQSDDRGFLIWANNNHQGTPVADLEVGDIVLLSPYEPHRTYVKEGMTQSRLSLDMRFCNTWRK